MNVIHNQAYEFKCLPCLWIISIQHPRKGSHKYNTVLCIFHAHHTRIKLWKKNPLSYLNNYQSTVHLISLQMIIIFGKGQILFRSLVSDLDNENLHPFQGHTLHPLHKWLCIVWQNFALHRSTTLSLKNQRKNAHTNI